MFHYRPAGQDFSFDHVVPELAPFEITGISPLPELKTASVPVASYAKTLGWVGGEEREVECWYAPPGILLKVAGGSDFYIAPLGEAIVRQGSDQQAKGRRSQPVSWTALDREILVGPALVLALALRDIWCLHAGAVQIGGAVTAFLGESGQGKSTLAGYLAKNGAADWHLVADDILPVSGGAERMTVWPRFPQLKLPVDAQPGASLPEQLPFNRICVLATSGDEQDVPELQPLPPNEALQVLLSHTAGARLFSPALMAKHLAFCAGAARQSAFYRLIYPHRRESLLRVREFMEGLC